MAKNNDSVNTNILKNSLSAFIMIIIGLIAGYGFIYIIAHNYGARGTGIYSLATASLFVLGMMANFGFNNASLKYIGKFQSENKLYKIKDLYKIFFQISIPISIIISILLYTFSNALSEIIFKDADLAASLKIISLVVPFYVLFLINVELIRGFNNIKLSEFLRRSIIPIINIILILTLGHKDINLPVVIYDISLSIAFLISSFYLFAKFKNFTQSEKISESRRQIIKSSSAMMITGLAFFFMTYTDTFMLGIFTSTDSIGIYNVAIKLAATTSFILIALNTVVAPKFSHLFWAKKQTELENIVNFSAKIIFWFSLPVVLLLIIMSGFLMNLFGPEFTVGRNVVIILALSQFLNAICGTAGSFMKMTGSETAFRNIVILAMALNIILNLFLIPLYGINGAAIASFISMALWNIASVIMIKQKNNINAFYFPFITR
ncbi:MAG: flippase [Patescibacteria group bacterium]